MSTRTRTRAAIEAAAVQAVQNAADADARDRAAQADRQRRRKSVVGMLVCVALINAIQYGYFNRQPTVGPLVFFAGSVMFLAGFALLGFYIAACIVYARMRGYGVWAGIGGALAGMAVWLGITLYLQWGIVVAIVQHTPTPDWDEHAPIALWVGLAIGGILLKSLPARPGSAFYNPDRRMPEDTVV